MSLNIFQKKTSEPDSSYVLIETLADGVTTTLADGLIANTSYTFKGVRNEPGKIESIPVITTATTLSVGNSAPVANAGTDNTITLPTDSVTLNGSGIDNDGTIASYSWTKLSGTGGTINNPGSATTTVTGLTQGTYVFRLVVTDNNGAVSSPDDTTIIVNAANAAPVANAGSDNTITLPTNSVTLTGSGTDSDGTVASYAWSKLSGPAGSTITSPASASTTVTGLVEGIYVFRLTITDDDGTQHADDVQVTVNPQAVVPKPAAPTNFVVNNGAKTFDWTNNPAYTTLADYEYTTTTGVVVLDVTTKPQTIPNNNYAIGTVGVRVKAAPDGTREPSDWLYNDAPFTLNQTVKANVVFVGNSIVSGGGSQGTPFPTVVDNILASDYVCTNKGISGQSLEAMQTNIQTQLLDLKNVEAAHNIAVIMEGTNSLSNPETTADNYYAKLSTYANQAKANGWETVLITIPPRSQTGTTDANPRAITINTAIRNNTSGIANRVVNLGVNARVGSFGTAAFGQDSGYSSFNTNWYYDGVHPTPYVHNIIGHLVADQIINLVDGASVPDGSIYPIDNTASTVEYTNLVGSAVDANNRLYWVTGANYAAGATSKKAIGSTGQVGLQGVLEFMSGGTAGGFVAGVGSTNPNASYTSMKHAFWCQNGGSLKVFEGGVNRGTFGTWNSTSILKIEVYNDHAKYYRNEALIYTGVGVPAFPCFMDVSFETSGSIKNAKMYATNLVTVYA